MTKFSDLKLGPKVLQAVEEAGYTQPTPIQEGAIPAALEGRDVLGIAQTGTGKTASFTLPMITQLARGRAKARMPRSLVLCPTRELAAQVAENFDTYSKYVKLTKALLIGGVSFKEQDLLIDKGVDVLIATPGRLLDHIGRGKLILNDVKIMVVDEADRMLDMGFIPDIEEIFKKVPLTRQTLFFSATMAPEIERITNTFLNNPVKVEVARQATASETIEQVVVMFKGSRKDRQPGEKRELLRDLIASEGAACRNAIVFCNRKTEVDIVAKSLQKYGLDAAPIHGDLEQSQRTRTLDGFRAGTLRFLIASDVAARGLDVPAVSHVFNFDVPSHAEDYIHRIGRTGRAGLEGRAIMICTPSDERNLEDVERLLGKAIPRMQGPLGNIGGDETPAPEVVRDPRPQTARDPVADPATTADTPSPRRTRTRSRSKSAEADVAVQAAPVVAAPVVAAPVVAAPVVAAPVVAAPVAPQKPTLDPPAREAAPRTRQPDALQSHQPQQQFQPQQGQSRSRGGRGGRSGGGSGGASGGHASGHQSASGHAPVVGMGDHMPTFIEKSFDERMAG